MARKIGRYNSHKIDNEKKCVSSTSFIWHSLRNNKRTLMIHQSTTKTQYFFVWNFISLLWALWLAYSSMNVVQFQLEFRCVELFAVFLLRIIESRKVNTDILKNRTNRRLIGHNSVMCVLSEKSKFSFHSLTSQCHGCFAVVWKPRLRWKSVAFIFFNFFLMPINRNWVIFISDGSENRLTASFSYRNREFQPMNLKNLVY